VTVLGSFNQLLELVIKQATTGFIYIEHL